MAINLGGGQLISKGGGQQTSQFASQAAQGASQGKQQGLQEEQLLGQLSQALGQLQQEREVQAWTEYKDVFQQEIDRRLQVGDTSPISRQEAIGLMEGRNVKQYANEDLVNQLVASQPPLNPSGDYLLNQRVEKEKKRLLSENKNLQDIVTTEKIGERTIPGNIDTTTVDSFVQSTGQPGRAAIVNEMSILTGGKVAPYSYFGEGTPAEIEANKASNQMSYALQQAGGYTVKQTPETIKAILDKQKFDSQTEQEATRTRDFSSVDNPALKKMLDGYMLGNVSGRLVKDMVPIRGKDRYGISDLSAARGGYDKALNDGLKEQAIAFLALHQTQNDPDKKPPGIVEKFLSNFGFGTQEEAYKDLARTFQNMTIDDVLQLSVGQEGYKPALRDDDLMQIGESTEEGTFVELPESAMIQLTGKPITEDVFGNKVDPGLFTEYSDLQKQINDIFQPGGKEKIANTVANTSYVTAMTDQIYDNLANIKSQNPAKTAAVETLERDLASITKEFYKMATEAKDKKALIEKWNDTLAPKWEVLKTTAGALDFFIPEATITRDRWILKDQEANIPALGGVINPSLFSTGGN